MTSGTQEKIKDTTAPILDDGIDPYAVNTILDSFKDSGKDFMNVYCLVAGYMLKPKIGPVKELTCDIVNNKARPVYNFAAEILVKRGVKDVIKLPEDEKPKY